MVLKCIPKMHCIFPHYVDEINKQLRNELSIINRLMDSILKGYSIHTFSSTDNKMGKYCKIERDFVYDTFELFCVESVHRLNERIQYTLNSMH